MIAAGWRICQTLYSRGLSAVMCMREAPSPDDSGKNNLTIKQILRGAHRKRDFDAGMLFSGSGYMIGQFGLKVVGGDGNGSHGNRHRRYGSNGQSHEHHSLQIRGSVKLHDSPSFPDPMGGGGNGLSAIPRSGSNSSGPRVDLPSWARGLDHESHCWGNGQQIHGPGRLPPAVP